MNSLWNLWKREPARLTSLLTAAFAVLVGFGVPLSPERQILLIAFVTLLMGELTRSQVTSGATLEAMKPQDLKAAQQTPEPVGEIVKKLP